MDASGEQSFILRLSELVGQLARAIVDSGMGTLRAGCSAGIYVLVAVGQAEEELCCSLGTSPEQLHTERQAHMCLRINM